MAQRVVVQLISDVSGEEIADGRGETVEFTFRGASYTIDLTDKEAAAFDKSIAPYVENATRQGGRRRKTAASTGDYDPKVVRAWAKSHGIEVPDRGRIPREVVERYKAS